MIVYPLLELKHGYVITEKKLLVQCYYSKEPHPLMAKFQGSKMGLVPSFLKIISLIGAN